MVVRREWTRKFWERAQDDYELVTSPAVIDELRKKEFPGQKDALDLMSYLPLIPLESKIADIVIAYIENKVMPADPSGDALHLALASFHKCEFLLTWNCNHLANANKFGHIRRINDMLKLFVPVLVTPLELLGELE